MNTEQTTVVSVRLPRALHRQLKRQAERNVRSLNSELIVAVRLYLTGREPEPVLERVPIEEPENV